MKKKIAFVMALALLAFAATAGALWNDEDSIVIESLESRTQEDLPVYNEIKWLPGKGRDVWMMNQSHVGSHAQAGQWERLAIVVDKTKSPKVAKFYQLQAGELEWKEDLPEAPKRVSCYMCHANGPRAIRPNFASSDATLTGWQKAKIAFWNARIKSYGRVVADPSMSVGVPNANGFPFRLEGKFENKSLKVKTCQLCHKEDGFLARGELKGQHFMAIKFMVDSGQMPPLGIPLSKEEREEIDRFLKGF